MAAAFERYKADETTPSLPNSAAIESTSGLRFGSRGPHVSKLQKGLSKLGYILVVDGLFGLVTDRVVRQFQRDNLLQENGIVGAVEENLIFKVDILRKIKRKLPTGSNVTITAPFVSPGHCSRKVSDSFSGIIGKTTQRLLSFARRFA